MLSKVFSQNIDSSKPLPQEGELYKTVNVEGVMIELRYGYYEDCDRENPLVEPMPIYPDFIKEPQYAENGAPIITMMQDACEQYTGKKKPDVDCGMCKHFQRKEELFGICTCPENQKLS